MRRPDDWDKQRKFLSHVFFVSTKQNLLTAEAGRGGRQKKRNNMVYKYYSSNCYTCDALTKGYFFFNKAAKQNDPYDTSFKLIRSEILLKELGMLSEDTQGKVESIMKQYGSCCFSEEWNNKHLWSFYASNYQGIVIGFGEDTFASYFEKYRARIHFVKVSYINSPITDDDVEKTFQLDMPLLRKEDSGHSLLLPHTYRECCTTSDDKLKDILFTHLCSIKEKATWGEEKESRLIAASDVINGRGRLESKGIKYLANGYMIPMPADCIKKIIVGHNFDMSKSHLIETIAKKNGITQIFQTKADSPFKIELNDITHLFNL